LQDGGFPRLHRRGLIEARKIGARLKKYHKVFRGFTAAASLKLRIWRASHQARPAWFSAASPPRPH